MKHIKDSERYSIVQLQGFKEECFICHKPSSDIHECFGGYNRQASKDYGLCVSLCRACHDRAHNDKEARRHLEQVGKRAFMEWYEDLELFRKVFHKYYV